MMQLPKICNDRILWFKSYAGFFVLLCTFGSCQFSEPAFDQQTATEQAPRSKDTTALKALVRNMYAWVETQAPQGDFLPANSKDDYYHTIDWPAHAKKVTAIKESHFFAGTFIENYSMLAAAIDSALVSGSVKWAVGDMAPFSTDADAWCNCQDSPERYWDSIDIVIGQLSAEQASLSWHWSGQPAYLIDAVKTDGNWQISHLQGFDKADWQTRLREAK